MTAAQALVADLRARGVRLWREGDQLRWQAPRPGVVHAEELERLRAAKAEVIAMLEAEAARDPRAWARCWHCKAPIPRGPLPADQAATCCEAAVCRQREAALLEASRQ